MRCLTNKGEGNIFLSIAGFGRELKEASQAFVVVVVESNSNGQLLPPKILLSFVGISNVTPTKFLLAFRQ